MVLLDGFDEMASRALEQEIVNQFGRLASLVRGRRAKVLVTCRSNYFISDATLLTAVRQAERQSDLLQAVEGRPGFVLATLERLTGEQVKGYLRSRLEEQEAPRIERLIWELYDLPDLSRLPLLLEMIVDSREGLLETGLGKLNVSDLYATFTDRWLRRVEEEDTLSAQEKLAIMRTLARDLWTRGLESLDMKELYGASLTLYNAHRGEEDWLHRVAIESRHATFLARDGEQGLRFAHKSFLEFFFAYDIVKRLAAGEREPVPGGYERAGPPRYVTQEVAKFLDGLLLREGREAELRARLDALPREAPEPGQRAAALVASYQLHSLKHGGPELLRKLAEVWGPGLPLGGVNLSHQQLEFVSLAGADLREVNLTGANLNGADLSGAVLGGAQLNDVIAEGSRWVDAVLSEASAEQVRWSSSNLDGARLDRAPRRRLPASSSSRRGLSGLRPPFPRTLSPRRSSWPR